MEAKVGQMISEVKVGQIGQLSGKVTTYVTLPKPLPPNKASFCQSTA